MAVDQEQVRITVVVVIKELQPPPAQQLGGGPDLSRFVGKSQFFLVVVQTEEFLVNVSNKKVLPSVAVIVRCIHAHTGARSPGFAVRYTCPETGFLESAAPFVDEKKVWHRIIRHKQIHKAIVIHIGCDRPERLSGIVCNSRFSGDVSKRAITIVVKQMARPWFEEAWNTIVAALQGLVSA